MAEPKKTKSGGKGDDSTREKLGADANVSTKGSVSAMVGEFVNQDKLAVENLSVSSVLVDERHLSVYEKVGRLKQLVVSVHKIWLLIGLWALLNIFGNDLKEARSKNPKKETSFNDIAEHPELPPELKGGTLRRYLMAAVTMKELEAKEVPVENLEYSHFREISKIPEESAREKVAREVVLKSLKVKETENLVKEEILKVRQQKGGSKKDASSESRISALTENIILRLDEPSSYILADEDMSSLLLEPTRVRAEFTFREQTKIYEKAEKVLKKKSDLEATLKRDYESANADVNFLKGLMVTFDGNSAATSSQD